MDTVDMLIDSYVRVSGPDDELGYWVSLRYDKDGTGFIVASGNKTYPLDKNLAESFAGRVRSALRLFATDLMEVSG